MDANAGSLRENQGKDCFDAGEKWAGMIPRAGGAGAAAAAIIKPGCDIGPP